MKQAVEFRISAQEWGQQVLEPVLPTDELTYWERVSRTRWGRYLTEIQRHILLSASKAASGSGTVLEIGADGGRWSSALMNEGWKVICTDISPNALDLCQRRLPRAQCIRVRPTDTSLPCATDAVKLILCMEVDSVISSEWFIAEASRVLTAGGILVATINNKFSLRGVFHEAFRSGDALTRKERGFYQVSYRDCRTALLRCGFELIHEEGCCWPPFKRDSNSFLVPFFVRLEKYLGLRRLTLLSPWVVFAAQKGQASLGDSKELRRQG
jgi:SAM-dependent methyltransferase